MTKIEYQELLKSKKYDFLRKDKRLGNNIILLVLGGSNAYGTNDENSDIDIRGISLDLVDDILGQVYTSEQGKNKVIEDKETDTVIYTLSKFIELATKGNPIMLEILGVREEDIIYITPAGRDILNNKNLFYSEKFIYTLNHFAESQLMRMEKSLAKDKISYSKQEEHLKKSLNRFITESTKMFTPYDPNTSISIYDFESKKEGIEKELFINMHFNNYPLRDLKCIVKEMTEITRTYDTLGHKNKKKDSYHINKHAMHILRLYLMGLDFIKTGELHTYVNNPKELNLLKEIKNGKFMLEDGSYSEDFFVLVNEFKNEFEKNIKFINLQNECDFKKISELKRNILLEQVKKFNPKKVTKNLYFKQWMNVPLPKNNFDLDELLDKYDKFYNSKEKYIIFQNALKEFDDLEEMVRYNRQLINTMVNYIISKPQYEQLINYSEDELKDKLSDKWEVPSNIKFSGSKRMPYTNKFINKTFLSIDLVQACFQVLNLFDKDILDCSSYEDFIQKNLKNESDAVKNLFLTSKYSREYLFGKTCPKRLMRLEKHLIQYIYIKLMEEIPELNISKNIVSLLHDELIIELTDDLDFDLLLYKLNKFMMAHNIKLHTDIFKLKECGDIHGFIKEIYKGNDKLVLVNAEDVPEAINYLKTKGDKL